MGIYEQDGGNKAKKRPFTVNCRQLHILHCDREAIEGSNGPQAHNCGVGTLSPLCVLTERDTLWILSQHELALS